MLVDDDQAVQRVHSRVLESGGFAVVCANSGAAAIEVVSKTALDAVVTDVLMPGITGIELLRRIHDGDSDLPVLFLTGNPSVESAAQALQFGALRYLVKPIEASVLLANVEEAAEQAYGRRLKRQATRISGSTRKFVSDRASLVRSFDNAFATLWMAYQPIVEPRKNLIVAYEALMRSEETVFGNPCELLDAAEQLGSLYDVGRRVRELVVRDLKRLPASVDVFVNLHPRDLADDALYDPEAPLSKVAPRVVLEMTERASLSGISDVSGRVARLRQLGYRIALDDLGAGYSGLNYFAQLTPEVAKLDMSLTRNIADMPVNRKLVGSLMPMCRELGIRVVAEGVETQSEQRAIADLGCDLMQGYFFAKPGKPFPGVAW